MSGFDTLEEQKELSDFLQKYGTANRIGQGLVAAEIALGAPALFRAGIKNVLLNLEFVLSKKSLHRISFQSQVNENH